MRGLEQSWRIPSAPIRGLRGRTRYRESRIEQWSLRLKCCVWRAQQAVVASVVLFRGVWPGESSTLSGSGHVLRGVKQNGS